VVIDTDGMEWEWFIFKRPPTCPTAPAPHPCT
jgi:hypothetical protein